MSTARQSSTLLGSIPETTTRRPSSLRLRRSGDSIRSIPSPKPAPSATLPEIPSASASAPTSSPIQSLPPRLPSIAINPTLSISIDRSSSSPTLPSAPAPPPTNRCSTSTVSTRARKVNRSHALARLEGRTDSTRRRRFARPAIPKDNFMSMSDDEDEQEYDLNVPPRGSHPLNHRGLTLSAILEPEDVVFPSVDYPKSAPADGRFPRSITSSHRRNQSSQTAANDWFPLKSFIDFHVDDDLSRWSWRSFIEVAKVS